MSTQAKAAASTAPEEESDGNLDRLVRARLGRFSLNLSPPGLMLVYLDWLVHALFSPGKQQQLREKVVRKIVRFWLYAGRSVFDPEAHPAIEPLPQDTRFSDPSWKRWPFNLYYQSFLLVQQWCHNATTGVRGVSKHHEDVVEFVTRQLLDVVSPSNFLATNPEVLEVTMREAGANLVRGLHNLLEDLGRSIEHRGPVGTEAFQPGRDVAVTPGKVVHRNRLAELIQYAPQTPTVLAEPILIVPAWIMKYYILDLSPANSLVNYLVGQGHTVFMLSWKNPGADDRDLGMDDYLQFGVMEALDAIRAIAPDRQVHAAGYCLGGTMLAIAAATLARARDDRLASVTLFAAETDFHEPGELSLFIDETEVTFLEDIMWEKGYLDTREMAGAFQLLRSTDLIWSRMIRDYMLGQRPEMTDLMAWNTDATRMPYRMHSEYLRRLFLNNDLAEGRYVVGTRPVTLADIRAPIFVVGTVRDHVAPWRSVYKIHLLTDTDVTFVLTEGGHNAGIVSEPGHPRRRFQIATRRADQTYQPPDSWQASAPRRDGSWWLAWVEWLAERSSGRVDPPSLGATEKGYPALENAPGQYVLMP